MRNVLDDRLAHVRNVFPERFDHVRGKESAVVDTVLLEELGVDHLGGLKGLRGFGNGDQQAVGLIDQTDAGQYDDE